VQGFRANELVVMEPITAPKRKARASGEPGSSTDAW